jgi:hypothetical protein
MSIYNLYLTNYGQKKVQNVSAGCRDLRVSALSEGCRETKNRKFYLIIYIYIYIFLFLDSRRPAEIGLVSFLDLPPCENVQKVKK